MTRVVLMVRESDRARRRLGRVIGCVFQVFPDAFPSSVNG